MQLSSASFLLDLDLQTPLFLCTPCQVSALVPSRRLCATPADLDEVRLQCRLGSSATSVEFLKRLDVRSNQLWGWRARHKTTLSSIGYAIDLNEL
jgi:hypothetical protein